MCKKKKPNLTNDNNLIFSSFHAKKEADKWSEIAKFAIKKNNFNIQAYVLLILSSEIYLKSLLMILGVNVIKKFKNNNGHNLYELYKSLPDTELKISIANNVMFRSFTRSSDLHNKDLLLKKFEILLKEISNGFVGYRYLYEKFLNHELINIPLEFIFNLNYVLYLECDLLKYEEIDLNGNVEQIKNPIVRYHTIEKGWIDSLDEVENN